MAENKTDITRNRLTNAKYFAMRTEMETRREAQTKTPKAIDDLSRIVGNKLGFPIARSSMKRVLNDMDIPYYKKRKAVVQANTELTQRVEDLEAEVESLTQRCDVFREYLMMKFPEDFAGLLNPLENSRVKRVAASRSLDLKERALQLEN